MLLCLSAAMAAASTHFLTRLGVDMGQVTVIGHNERFTINDTTRHYLIPDSLVIALLDDAVHWSDAIEADLAEGMRSIVGVFRITPQHTIVLFSHEHGDGAEQELAIYNQQGQLTDYIDTGYWTDTSPLSIDDDPQSEADVRWNSAIITQGKGDNAFSLQRTYQCCVWHNGNSSQAEVVGQRTYTYHYTIDQHGHLTLADVDSHDTGQVFEQYFRFEALKQMNWLPLNDPSRIQRLNQLIDDKEIQTEMARERSDKDYTSDAVYLVNLLIWNYFEQSPQAFFQWMYAHRNQTGNHLTAMVLEIIDSGLMSHDMACRAAHHIKNAKQRAYFLQLFNCNEQ